MKQVLLSPMHAYRPLPQWGVWLLAAMLVLLAPVAGLLAVTGSVFLVTIPVLLVLSLVLAFHPWLFTWLIIFSGLVVMGILKLYAPQFQVIRWLIPLMTLAVPIAVFLLQAFNPSPAEKTKLPALFWWGMAFVCASLASTLVNWSGLMTAISGTKNYFQVWGLILVFALIRYRGDFSRGLTILLVGVGLLQIPFVLHQHFFIVPMRMRFAGVGGLSPDDVIAGTFGAEWYGGGNNALLAAYLFIVISLLFSLWRNKVLPAWLVFPAALLLAFPVFLNEAKVALFYAWVMFVVLYWDDIARRPLRFIVANAFLVVFMSVFILFYAQIAAETGKAHTVGQYLDFLIEMNLYRGYGTYELNRWTALVFWFQEHFPHDLWHALVGHGLGETQEGSNLVDVSNSLAGHRYHGMGIGLTGLSALLWDVGLVGTMLVGLMFLSAYRLAGRLAKASNGNSLAMALFMGLQAGVAILALSIAHKSFFVFEMAFQILFVLIVGYLIYSARHLLQPDRQAPRAAGG
ncbi:MAG: hypothetical protein K8F26_13580 [Thiobacillus sp.]|nr:hypothetical protein [Thiobacillus sp.]